MNEQEQAKSDFKPEWKVDKVFERGEVVVQAWKSNHRTPHFRVSVGFKGREGKPVPSLAVFSDSGVVTTANPVADIIGLFNEAMEYVTKEIETNEARWQASRPQHTQGAEGRPGLKALGKKDRQNWEDRGRPERRRG